MKIAILILGFLFGLIAVWALFETFRSSKKSASRPQTRVNPPGSVDPQSLIVTDPYGTGKMRRGMRDTLPPGQHLT